MSLRRLMPLLAIPALLGAVPALAQSRDALVLVVARASPLQALDSLAMRKAFVGLPVQEQGETVRAVLNDSDASLRPLFLQHVVGFTESAYERRVLTLTIQQGRPAPPSARDQRALLNLLGANRYSVSYMWKSVADQLPELRVLRVVWQD